MRERLLLGRVLAVTVICAGWSGASQAQALQFFQDQQASGGSEEDQAEPRTPIPPITDSDREAAFPNVEPRTTHDDAVHAFVLVDELEWQGGGSVVGVSWHANGWIGRDLDRLWFRTKGHADDAHLGGREAHPITAEVQALYGRAFSRWWEVVVGVRQDVRPAPAQTWAAFGLQGLAPYWVEVEATGYVSDGGQTALRLRFDCELLWTNRLMLRPMAELDFYGKTNAERVNGAGLSRTDVGFRVRYEIRREVAPYVGVTWHRAFGETADLAQEAWGTEGGIRIVAGVRLWR